RRSRARAGADRPRASGPRTGAARWGAWDWNLAARVILGWLDRRLLGLPAVATAPSLDIELITLAGDAYTLEQRLTTFHLASVILDPYTNESSWVLKPAARILAELRGADVRVNFVATCGPNDARRFLAPLADEFLVFCDPDRAFVKGLGLATLPAFVFVR